VRKRRRRRRRKKKRKKREREFYSLDKEPIGCINPP